MSLELAVLTSSGVTSIRKDKKEVEKCSKYDRRVEENLISMDANLGSHKNTAYLGTAKFTVWSRIVCVCVCVCVCMHAEFDVRGSVHHSIIHKKNQQFTTVYQNFISYLYEVQRVSGNTPPIIRSLKLH
jgi:hypothetical protein